jgi:DNA-binding response OmpR family regulator
VPRILIVDDEPAIVELVRFNLVREGFEADAAGDGRTALRQLESRPYDLVVLDRMLPGIEGTEVLRQLRQHSRIPVILLTARGSEADRVAGLEAGADDYLVKPFSPRELVARVRAVLRRAGRRAAGGIVRTGDLEVDLREQRVRRAGRIVDLTATEFALLRELAEHLDQAVSREQLIEKVWGYDFDGDARTVDVHVRHLREKLEDNPSRPAYLETVRGVGYRLRGRGA